MNRILVYKNKISKTYYDPDKGILFYEYAGIMDRKATELQIKSVLEFVKDKDVHGILLDIRKLMGSFLKFIPYLREIYYPTLIARRLYCKTIVVSKDIITSRLSEKLYDLLIELGVKASIFNNLSEAEEWLDKMLTERINAHK